MKHQNDDRVLNRIGARKLNEDEVRKIHGGTGTTTFCTPPSTTQPNGDGDKGECG